MRALPGTHLSHITRSTCIHKIIYPKIFDSKGCIRKGFYTPLKLDQKCCQKVKSKFADQHPTYGLTAFSTWSPHQIKLDDKCCHDRNKYLLNVPFNIWTKSNQHMKCAPKLDNKYHQEPNKNLLNVPPNIWTKRILLHTFAFFVYFCALLHNFSAYGELSHTLHTILYSFRSALGCFRVLLSTL